jgi:hypothetical protein
MAKIVRKLLPTDTWRIGEHESWFSDMSLKGHHLKKMGNLIAQFEQGEPKQIEYRIEVTNKKEISGDQIDMYEENGWDYITSYQYFHVFSSPTERNAPELHTDAAEQAFTLEHLNKEFNWYALAMTISTTLIVGMLVAIWFLDGTPLLRLVEGDILHQIFGSLICLHFAYLSIRGMLAISSLRKSLIEGKVINHHAPWKKSLHRNKLLFSLLLAIAIINCVFAFIQLVKMDTFTLPTEDANLPFVRLADIEQNPNLERGESYIIDGVDWANSYTTNWSLFAPVQYETGEVGVIEGIKWADGSGTYSPMISSEVYLLTFKSFATPLIKDLIKWHTIGNETEPFLKLQHPELDQLITHEQDGRKLFFASEGKVVMFVQYFGSAEMETIIKNVAEKMKLIAEK